MNKRRAFLTITILTLALFSCSTSTAEEDVEEYCNCINDTKADENLSRCHDLVIQIVEKYENDPKAKAYVMEHSKECFSISFGEEFGEE